MTRKLTKQELETNEATRKHGLCDLCSHFDHETELCTHEEDLTLGKKQPIVWVSACEWAHCPEPELARYPAARAQRTL